VLAMRLAAVADSAWRFEAYEMLADLGQHSVAAQVLADQLAQGIPVPDQTGR
jgi:hypothetical protein